MTQGRSLNRKSFYGGMESGQAPDIAMPDLNEVPPVAMAAPEPWQEQSQIQAQPQTDSFGSVPDQVPQDVLNEMKSAVPDYPEEHEQEEVQARQEERKPAPNESFRAIRDAKERAERERDAMLSQMMEMQQRIQSMQQQQKPPQEEQIPDYDINIAEDDLAEGKHLKLVMARQKALEQQLKKYQTISEESALEARIRSQYPDFEKVVNKDNIDMLVAQYPDIANTLRNTSDLYSKAASTYTIIKNFGIHKDTPKYEADRTKAVNNAQKPRPLSSVSPTQGDTPLSKANAFAEGMTPELKSQLMKEMFAARKAL